MKKLISELSRLYLPDTVPPAVVEQHMLGQQSPGSSLPAGDGLTRAIVLAFRKSSDGEEAQHWKQLCLVANALQTQLGLPAPAVSISGENGYRLWLSLLAPVAPARVQPFLALLRAAYGPGMEPSADAAGTLAELPPCLHQHTGKWSAFIHPDLGASFADESGLDMAPPLAGQAALLEGLHSISEAQFLHALDVLQQAHGAAPVVSEPGRTAAAAGLLLKDATLEDIVNFLHSKNIEPTFRHLIPSARFI